MAVAVNALAVSRGATEVLPQLLLRAGHNIVEVSSTLRAGVSACALVVFDASPRVRVGADAPYTELEAEAAVTNGTIIGPGYAYYSLPSEASARRAVQLVAGQFVDFVVPAGTSVNAIAVRFSIPDASPGGLDASLLVLVDGALAANLTLTSAFAWYYGAYPFTKNPQDGRPHHFYDTVYASLGTVVAAPGSTIRLQHPGLPPVAHTAAAAAAAATPAAAAAPTPTPAPAPAKCIDVPVPDRIDCGFPGVNATQCEDKGCCFIPISPNPDNHPWCFKPWTPPPPPPPPPAPGNVTITVDLIDLYDVAAPAPAPANALSVLAHGADPTGKADSTAAIAATLAAAVAAAVPAWVPPGVFAVSGHLALHDNLTLLGAGPWHSVLRGATVGLYGAAGGTAPTAFVHVGGLSLVGDTRIRDDSMADTGVGGALSDSIIQDLDITHTKCGMWLDGPFSGLLVSGVRIHDTTADGVNFHRGVTNSAVEHSLLRNTGDDCLAMWSDGVADANCTFAHNTLQTPVLANNVAIYGGRDNAARANLIADTVAEGGGLHVGNRFGAVPLAGLTSLDGNELHRAGQLDPGWAFGVGAVWFYALDHPLAAAIAVTNTRIFDSPYEAFQFIGSRVDNVTVVNATVVNVGTFVWQAQAPGSASAAGVVATGTQYFGVYDCEGAAFTLADAGGNAGWNTSHCGFPPPAVAATVE